MSEKSIEIVLAALEGNALAVKELFDAEVGERVMGAVDEMRPEVAAAMFEASAFDPDYKSQAKDDKGVSKAGFRSKKTSTGTVYNRELGDDHAGEDTMKGSARKGVAFRKWSKTDNVKEEAEPLGEKSGAFDSDYKSQASDDKSGVSKAGFRSKKTSTGTVYNRELGDDNAGEDTMKGSARKGVAFRKWVKTDKKD